MIIILIISIVISLVCLGLSVYLYIYSKRLSSWVYNLQKTVNIINQQIIPEIKEEITKLKNNPAEFTKRFSLVDFKINNLIKAVENFNNGFGYRSSTM